jgi:acyl carrier protein
METVLEILMELQSEVNYEVCTTLIDDHILNSLTIIALVGELEDVFDITIPAVEIIPANFNSAQAIWAMVQRLMDED